jgi:putative dimethyl sulfoxide reductase chaperone
MPHPFSLSDQVNLAQARGSLSAFLSMHFLNMPDEAFLEHVRSEAVLGFLAQLAEEDASHPDLTSGAQQMLAYLEASVHQSSIAVTEELGVDRTRLYRGLSSALGPPPPYEAVWSRHADHPSRLIEEIAGLYHAEGLAEAPEANERSDNLGIELAYIEHLAEKEVEALGSDEDDEAMRVRRLQSEFFSKHLVQWVPRFVEKALEFAKTDFYIGHLYMLRGFVMEQAKLFETFDQ